MKLTLVVIGDGRGDYLTETVRSIQAHVLYPIQTRIMVNDEADPDYIRAINATYPDFIRVHTGRRGMAGAVQAGFDAAIVTDPDYVLWIEEDMLLTRSLPIGEAIAELEVHRNVAQMCFPREAVDPSEGDDQLAAICRQASFVTDHGVFVAQDFIFSMNPCLIPRRVLEFGWPSGPIGVGNEAGMTTKLLNAGYVFGQWGHPGDEPWARTIGYGARSPAWQL
jgi:hypothetical protein